MDIMVKNNDCKFKYRVSGVIIVNEKGMEKIHIVYLGDMLIWEKHLKKL